MKKIQEPFKDGRHTWFKIGEHAQLHVVGGAKAIVPHDINIHLSFHVVALKDFMDHLDKLQIKYGNWKGDSKNARNSGLMAFTRFISRIRMVTGLK